MSFTTEQLTVNGVRYATPELAAKVRREQEASEQAAQERKAKQAQVFERELQDRFMATPGATEDDWKSQRASIIAKAREAATLERADVHRTLNRSRYGG